MTNDGNSILREVDVSHPAAKSMIELSRAQDEEVGDGTTSVIVLAGEYLNLAAPLLERQLHPTTICNGYLKALDDAVATLDKVSRPRRHGRHGGADAARAGACDAPSSHTPPPQTPHALHSCTAELMRIVQAPPPPAPPPSA